MKKLIAMLLALVMVIGLVACGAPEVNEPVEEVPTVVEPVPEETEAPIEEANAYGIEFVNYVMDIDYENNPCLVVLIDWTNKTNETAAFYTTYTVKAFQDGLELDSAIVHWDSENYKAYEDSGAEIRPDASIRLAVAFTLRSDNPTVELEASEWISLTNEILASAIIEIPFDTPTEEIVDPIVESETEAPVEEVPTDDTLDTVESVISTNFTNYKLAVYFENNAYCVDILESDQVNSANVVDLVKLTALELYRTLGVEKVIITLYDNNEIIVSSEVAE